MLKRYFLRSLSPSQPNENEPTMLNAPTKESAPAATNEANPLSVR